jgi:hypothetical protein
MGSSGKTRTTFAKLSRESKLRDKRAEKEARKAARKLDAAANGEQGYGPESLGTESTDPDRPISDGPEAARGSDVSDLGATASEARPS